jgi:hypothetical protein
MLVSMSCLFYGREVPILVGGGGVQGGGVVGEERNEIHWKRPTLFWSCLTLFHHFSFVNLQKQGVPDMLTRLRERYGGGIVAK